MLQHLKQKIEKKNTFWNWKTKFFFKINFTRINIRKPFQFYQIGFFQQENIRSENFPLALWQVFAISRSASMLFVSALQELKLPNYSFPRRCISQKIIIVQLKDFF